jgi:hypothetical protein
MAIFKLQAKDNNDTVTAQKVVRDHAQSERVIEEEQELENTRQNKIQHRQVTPAPTFQVKYTNKAVSANRTLPKITQDKYKAPQLANTHQQ